jgi:hypothetical protein
MGERPKRPHVDGEEVASPGKQMSARELTGSVTGEHVCEGAEQMRWRMAQSELVVCARRERRASRTESGWQRYRGEW